MINKLSSFIVIFTVSSFLLGCGSTAAPQGTAAAASQNEAEIMAELISEQHTTRVFTNQRISEEDLQKIVSCAFDGASSGGQQAKEVIVVNDPNIMNRIQEVHPYAGSLDTAQAVLVIAGNENHAVYPENLSQDTSLAAQNVVLMAESLKIGFNIMSIYPQEDRISSIKSILQLPEGVTPYLMISLGYAAEDEQTSASSKQQDNSAMIHYNGWQGQQ